MALLYAGKLMSIKFNANYIISKKLAEAYNNTHIT